MYGKLNINLHGRLDGVDVFPNMQEHLIVYAPGRAYQIDSYTKRCCL